MKTATARREHEAPTATARSRRWIALTIPLALTIPVALGVLLRGGSADPPKPTRKKFVYNESLQDGRYSNRDLGFTVDSPSDWIAALGSRAEEGEEDEQYEGLVVKMEPDIPQNWVEPTTGARPFISIVRRAVPKSTVDPVEFIRTRLLSGGKTVREEPRALDVAGQRMGRVVYELPAGKGSLRVLQLVRIANGNAIVLTAMAPSHVFNALDPKLAEMLKSLRFEG